MKIRKIIMHSIWLLAASLLLTAVLIGMRTDGASTALTSLPLGSTYEELVLIAGSPEYETDGTVWVEPGYKKVPNQIATGCVREVWYESWPILTPNKITFCFDKNGLLVDKYHWSSW